MTSTKQQEPLQKKYDSILRNGHPDLENIIHPDDCVVVMEKLDGANASFMVDENQQLRVFSRNMELDETETLRGFYEWVHQNINPLHVDKNYVYFGEWLVKHKLRYGENENQFYLFDIYHKKEGKYESIDKLIKESRYLNIPIAPIFYIGPFKNESFMKQFVGKSVLGEHGEGIVVKKQNGQLPFMKMVGEHFTEVKPQKELKPSTDAEAMYIQTFLTKARVEKELYKLIDEKIIPEKLHIEYMQTILSHLVKRVHDDILKEEKPPTNFNIKASQKLCGKWIPSMVKEIIDEGKQSHD